MMGTNSEARKAREGQPLAVLREADRLERKAAVLRALRRVYFDADHFDGDALTDALVDEGVIA